MSIVDLLDIPRLSQAQLSPDGTRLLFQRSDSDWQQNERTGHLWLADVATGQTRQLTFGHKGEGSGVFSPDGRSIAFLAQRGDDEHDQVYLLPVDGGEARRLFAHDTAPGGLSWSRDGSALYFLASDPQSDEEKKKDELKDDVFAFDEDFKQRHLWRFELATEKPERLTEGDFSISSIDLSRDGSQMVLHRAPTPLFDDSDESEIWLADGDGKQMRRLTNNGVNEGSAQLSRDGKSVLFLAGANREFESYFNTNLFLQSTDGTTAELQLAEMPYEIYDARWSKDGGSIYFVANTGLRSQLFETTPGSKAYRALTSGDHALSAWSYEPTLDRHVYAKAWRDNAGDFFVHDGEREQQVTRVFDALEETFLLPRQESFTWKGVDGEDVEGLLFYPLAYEAGKRYPLVVQTHGGPASSDKFGFGRWNSYPQVLAARGFMVFKPNYRGSTGYGDDFLRDMVGHYFENAHLDVMTGVDALIAQGLADPDRMVKMGWSAGGHMTNKIITHTNRFKAASSGAGAVNWVSMYGQSDVRIYRTPWFGGTPWQEDAPIDVYWQNSPLRDIHKVETPTLVLVGENDVRVPPPQSVELYRALKTNGVPTRLYIAPREPHGWGELRHQLFKVNVELAWFEKYALGREYEWEAAPGSAADEGTEGAEESTPSSEATPTGSGE
jgi:dipeptidyl aminopeptidase/acylaminoacyl peptidase